MGLPHALPIGGVVYSQKYQDFFGRRLGGNSYALVALALGLKVNRRDSIQLDHDRYFHIAVLVRLRPDGVGAGGEFDLLRVFVDAGIMIFDPLHHFAGRVVDAVTSVEVVIAAFTPLGLLSGGEDLEVAKGGLVILSGKRAFARTGDARRGLPLQDEASQEQELSRRPGQCFSQRTRGKFAGVETHPCRAMTSHAFGTVAMIDAVTAGFLYASVISVHIDLFFSFVVVVRVDESPSRAFLMRYPSRTSFIPRTEKTVFRE